MAESPAEALAEVRKISGLVELARGQHCLILGVGGIAKLMEHAQCAQLVDDRVAAAFAVLESQCAVHVGEHQEQYRKLLNLRSASAAAVRGTEGLQAESFEKLVEAFDAQSAVLKNKLVQVGEAPWEEEIVKCAGASSSSFSSSSGSSSACGDGVGSKVGSKRKGQSGFGSTHAPKRVKTKRGSRGAQMLCEEGDDLYGGRGFKILDQARGQLMIEAAAVVGYAMAEAYCRYHGWCGHAQDEEKAFVMFKEIAEETGSAYAENMSGECFYYGRGVAQDLTKAVKCFTKAAEKGNSAGMERLGLCFEFGRGVEKNLTTAVVWYTKAVEKGNSAAMSQLGFCLQHGKGVEKDLMKAVELYTKSAEMGDSDGMNNLGTYYFEHSACVDERGLAKAVEWFAKSAENGSSYAMNNLGCCFEHGTGVEQNWTKAIEWYTMSAEKGNCAAAMNNLGVIFSRGNGVEKDLNKAIEWYTKSAEMGNTGAMNNLGFFFHHADGADQNWTKAVEWYTKAAEKGNSAAMYNLGFGFHHGIGVEQDLAKAVEWYTKARDMGTKGMQGQIDEINARLAN
jgi:TPR repeat protein